MGINVQLVKETGAVVEEVLDGQNQLVGLFESLPDRRSTHCIQYIDPYGDTVFNALQIGRFLHEWQQVETLAMSTEQSLLASRIKQLATTCQEDTHLYLKFIGD